MSRYHKLLEKINVVLKNDKSGKYEWRQVRIRILKRVVKDLIHLKQLPPDWHHINNEHLFALTNHWRNQKLSESTIGTYLAAIRYFFDMAKVNTSLASNAELGVIREYSKSNPNVSLDDYNKMIHPYVKCIFGFELLFGLHRTEAIKIIADYNLLSENQLWVTRNIAFNGIERIIPIVTDEQSALINTFKQTLPHDSSMTSIIEQRALINMYKVEISAINLKTNEQYRKNYARYRAKTLENVNSPKQIRTYLKNEMGIKSDNILREYLA